MSTVSLGEELERISARLDAASSAWNEAGCPLAGPLFDARQQVYVDLADWNRRVVDTGRYGTPA